MSSLRTVSQANELADAIRQRIQAEQLAEGALFMTEGQLAEEYGASRTVVREAVSRLQALGLLEGRKRKGLIVRHPDPLRLLSNSLPSLVGSQEDWRELAMLRYALEVGAIDLAIRAATDEQLARLSQITDDMEAALRDDTESERTVALDLEFHALILQMTGSRMIAGMQQLLVQFFQIAPHAENTPASAERIIWEHRELCSAIRDRDVERARSMIRLQFRSTLGAVESLSPESGGADRN
ncbi:FadR/GntR family transcriptional regulator [Planctomyces sp. SH-PL14]|uniref:FadR/GntR family transcriptional regulator n=1 Tax=Planctomyces sp. SH-PL14 TaxID=1632864 RepID=UPI00078B7A56|nr:FCD domain-containing protein [Planctomyces sp. SH-PL14]AMV20876.1 HTH-type transcriptional regulator LutR [Planctomyces sp. SH-PL14]